VKPSRWFVATAGLAVVACGSPVPGSFPVRPGIDVLLTDSIHLVRGRRVGLLTNQTGVDQSGVPDVERLLGADVRLTAVFSPEHGFRGQLDREGIEHGTDSAAGLPIFSLYGEVRAPTKEMLASIDVLLVDLQDVGARPYTYISTALLAMRAAAPVGVPVIILDRPNPIGGEAVQGPLLDPEYSSFVGMLRVPLRHGMSLGELARLGNRQLDIGADLAVVPAAGWRRDMWFDDTGLPWVRPSPNMPDLESATHYPGLVLFEGTNLSVGRGTPMAFQIVGAPWLDAEAVIARLGTVEGVAASDTLVVPVAPGDGKYPDVPIASVRFKVVDRRSYDPVELAARLLEAIRISHPDSFRLLSAEYFDARAGSDQLRQYLLRGASPELLFESWKEGEAEFLSEREPFLIYR